MKNITNIAAPEYKPVLDYKLVDPDRVSVQFDIAQGCEQTDPKTLSFSLVDTTEWPAGSKGRAIVTDRAGTSFLVVERGKDRIFTLDLSPAWRWVFDLKVNRRNTPMTMKKDNAPFYKVIVKSDTQIEIHAKARPHMPTGTATDLFNLHVLMAQDSGSPIALRIDPGTKNPPPGP